MAENVENIEKNAKKECRNTKKANIWLVVALCLSVAGLITTTALWQSSKQENSRLGYSLENVYQKNYYDLIDNIQNSQVKMSKILASNYDSYTNRLLDEVSKNISSANNNLGDLPISMNGIDETKKFLNQASAYMTALSKKIDKGGKVTQKDKLTLQEINDALVELENSINEINQKYMLHGYNILKDSSINDGDYNGFTLKIKGLKSTDTQYPTMIYDGPFSDTMLNTKAKNMNFGLVSVNVAKDMVKKMYSNVEDKNIKYKNETNGKISTFNFEVKINNLNLYVQVSKNGGKIISVSGYGDGQNKTVTLTDAISKAKLVAENQTGLKFDCVWSDIVGNDAYINLAPIQNKIILYPDLIKVKIDLESGEIIGYSATTFYMNHTPRVLTPATYEKTMADKKVPGDFKVVFSRLCLAPIDFTTEVLCYEYKCEKDDDTYYIYINASTGETENILKVIQTNDGSKLM